MGSRNRLAEMNAKSIRNVTGALPEDEGNLVDRIKSGIDSGRNSIMEEPAVSEPRQVQIEYKEVPVPKATIVIAEKKNTVKKARTFYMSDDLYEKLRVFATNNGRSSSEALTEILQQVLPD